jgi:hypothetical protein
MYNFELPKSMGPGKVFDAYGANRGIVLKDLDRRDIVILRDGESAAQVVDKHPTITRYMMYLSVPGFRGFAVVKSLEDMEEHDRYFQFRFRNSKTQTYVERINAKGDVINNVDRDEELTLAALNYSLMTEYVSYVPLLFRRYASIKVSTGADGSPPFGVQCEYHEGSEHNNYGQGLHLRDVDEHAGILPIRYYSDNNGGLHVLARVEKHVKNSHSSYNYILYPLHIGDQDQIVIPERVTVINENSATPGFSQVQSNDMRKRVKMFNRKYGNVSCIWGTSPTNPLSSAPNESLVMFNQGEQPLGAYYG